MPSDNALMLIVHKDGRVEIHKDPDLTLAQWLEALASAGHAVASFQRIGEGREA